MVRMMKVLVSTSAMGWLSALGLTVVRVVHGRAIERTAPIYAFTLAVADTATIAAVILYAVPPTTEAYRMGLEVGEQRGRLGDIPWPRLRSVP